MQRRTLAACIFALAFILFYEARGERLIQLETDAVSVEAPTDPNADRDTAEMRAARTHFFEQAGAGAFVMTIGVMLILLLRRPGQPLLISRTELTVYALGIGLLLGTAFSSWLKITRVLHGT